MAMLLLFKPWRVFEDLKGMHESWKDAFENAQFDDHSLLVMRHFREWYECKDASDVYRDLKNKGVIIHDISSADIMNEAIDSKRVRGSADLYDWINEHHPALEGLLSVPVDDYDDDGNDKDDTVAKQIVISQIRTDRQQNAKKIVSELIKLAGDGFLMPEGSPSTMDLADCARESVTVTGQSMGASDDQNRDNDVPSAFMSRSGEQDEDEEPRVREEGLAQVKAMLCVA
ncbi:hypothetical protein AURDEDRAFT_163047 [Auricularia subglabra TFB-10046 SS5]|nr:hypothetical protein AURDEDRAFT_163047 [Auricularia subglabra TFB-10046 SS5]